MFDPGNLASTKSLTVTVPPDCHYLLDHSIPPRPLIVVRDLRMVLFVTLLWPFQRSRRPPLVCHDERGRGKGGQCHPGPCAPYLACSPRAPSSAGCSLSGPRQRPYSPSLSSQSLSPSFFVKGTGLSPRAGTVTPRRILKKDRSPTWLRPCRRPP